MRTKVLIGALIVGMLLMAALAGDVPETLEQVLVDIVEKKIEAMPETPDIDHETGVVSTVPLPIPEPESVAVAGGIVEGPDTGIVSSGPARITMVPKSPTISTCDPVRVFKEYKQATDAKAALVKEIAEVKAKVNSLSQRIAAYQETMDSLRKRSKGYKALSKVMKDMQVELADFVKTKDKELTTKRDALKESSIAAVSAAIAKVAKDKGCNLVLSQRAKSRGTVLYADDTLDITDAVIKVLNSKPETAKDD